MLAYTFHLGGKVPPAPSPPSTPSAAPMRADERGGQAPPTPRSPRAKSSSTGLTTHRPQPQPQAFPWPCPRSPALAVARLQQAPKAESACAAAVCSFSATVHSCSSSVRLDAAPLIAEVEVDGPWVVTPPVSSLSSWP